MPLYRPGSSSERNARGVSSTSSIGLRFGVYNPAGDALDLAVQIKGASEFQLVAVTLGGHAGQLPFDVVGFQAQARDFHGIGSVFCAFRHLVQSVEVNIGSLVPRARVLFSKNRVFHRPIDHRSRRWHPLIAANGPQRFAGAHSADDLCFHIHLRLNTHHIPVRDQRIALAGLSEFRVFELTEADHVAGLEGASTSAIVEVHLHEAPCFLIPLARTNSDHSTAVVAFNRSVFAAPPIALDGNDEARNRRRDGFVQFHHHAILERAHHFFGSGLRYLSRKRFGSRSASFTDQPFLPCKTLLALASIFDAVAGDIRPAFTAWLARAFAFAACRRSSTG